MASRAERRAELAAVGGDVERGVDGARARVSPIDAHPARERGLHAGGARDQAGEGELVVVQRDPGRLDLDRDRQAGRPDR